MKRFFILLLLSLLTILITGCDSDDIISQYTVNLETLASNSDYLWKYKVEKIGIVNLVNIKINSMCDDSDDKCLMNEVYSVSGLKEGKTSVTFFYYNSVSNEIMYEAKYVFEVDSKLNISEISHSGSYFEK